MLKGYRRHLTLCYISNIAARINAGTVESREFVKSLRGILDEIDIDAQSLGTMQPDRAQRGTSDYDRRPSVEEWDVLQKAIENARSTSSRFEKDYLHRRAREFADLMSLNEIDVALLEFFLYYETDPGIEHCINEVLDYQPNARSRYNSFSVLNPNVAHMLGMSRGRIRERFVSDAPLVQSGIVTVDQEGEITLLNRLKRLAYEPTTTTRHIHQILFEKTSTAELEWQDFDHVESGRDHIERLIVGALEKGERGVNVLIHGPPGTGKTEFCKTLADRIGVTLFSVGESSAHGHEPSRAERLQELRLAERVLGATQNSVLLFDEMEDLLSYSDLASAMYGRNNQRYTRGSEGSKVFMHRLLERNTVPVLWTSNAAHRTNPALLRRMMYALELSQPSVPIRARIWRRQLKRHGIQSTHRDAESLARDFDVTPGVVDRAVVAARLIDSGDVSTVYKGVASLSRLIHGPKPPQSRISEFDLSLMCANADLIELSDRLVALGVGRFSVCLQGPPGTGKSAFVRYLSKRLGLEILQKRASDLLSMWVGETEVRIARAFAEARDKEQFLVFDEAESLLADRRFADRNWEVSQVNEMLTWMESHPMPFACTTNYDERLDPATLRRFDFKLRLDFLTPDLVRLAFKTFFDMPPPDELGTLTNITPGDFAVVKRRVAVLGKTNDTNAIAAMLKEESDAKPERTHPIGFQNGDV